MNAARRLVSSLLVAMLTAAAAAQTACDPGLDRARAAQPVFVRMRQQLFALGGEYEAFCREHATTPRHALRRQVLADLQARAAASWQQVEAPLTRLQQDGHLQHVQRFWIVNGFAADADGAAVQALAALPAVAFVHRQTQPGRSQQRQVVRDADWLRERGEDEHKALAMLRARGSEGAFTSQGLTVPWNLSAIGADAAWQQGATGQGVVIAMLDSGVLCMPPLVEALWQNPEEPPDGLDNDGNGYVDDLFGWDFDGGTRFVVGDGAQSHGSMCGGILAGRPWGEPLTVTGVAPRARLMVLRGMGRLSAYEYAASMGADVLSMSYMWVNTELGSYRGVFRTAHEHLAACGVVAVGGAGNFAQQAPSGHQIALPKDIPCVITAAGIGQGGTAPAFSSRGPCTWDDVLYYCDYPPSAPLSKPDVSGCNADFPLWHWTQSRGRQMQVLWQQDGMGLIQGPRGNSFAGPHAGGVAALMLSANPELTPWRVQQLMIATCKELGDAGWDATYGAGLLQADAAVRAAQAAVVQ